MDSWHTPLSRIIRTVAIKGRDISGFKTTDVPNVFVANM